MKQSNPLFNFEIITIEGYSYEKIREELPSQVVSIARKYSENGTHFDTDKEYVFIPARQIKKIIITVKRKGFGFDRQDKRFYT